MKIGHNNILKSWLQLVLGLFIFALILFLFMRWQAKGYEKYVFYVHAQDEGIFAKALTATDPQIFKFGRILKDDVIEIDNREDNGDGDKMGSVRWYLCKGIDCDEGWESSFTRR